MFVVINLHVERVSLLSHIDSYGFVEAYMLSSSVSSLSRGSLRARHRMSSPPPTRRLLKVNTWSPGPITRGLPAAPSGFIHNTHNYIQTFPESISIIYLELFVHFVSFIFIVLTNKFA